MLQAKRSLNGLPSPANKRQRTELSVDIKHKIIQEWELRRVALTKDEDYLSILPFINMTEDKLLKKRMQQMVQVNIKSYLTEN